MKIDWWTLVLQLVNGLILIWLLTRFLFRPVVKIISARQEEAAGILAQADRIHHDAEKDRLNAQQQLKDLDRQKNTLLQAAASEAERLKQEALKKAKLKAEKIGEETRIDIARQRHQASLEIETRANELAMDIAARLMDQLPDSARVAGFIDGLVESLGQLTESERADFGNDAHSLLLTSSRALTIKESKAVHTALAGVLGRDVAVEMAVDPALIAGLELEGTHTLVRNSIRAYLQQLNAALTDDKS